MATQVPLFASPTDKQRRALAILKAGGGLEPLAFARAMWPDSKGWAKRGRFYWSMERVALGMLGQLCRAGYAFEQNGKWHAMVNVDYVTLARPTEPVPF